MKKTNLTRVIAIIAAICILSVCFVSCKKEQSVNGYCTVVLGNEEETSYTVNLDKVTVDKGLISLLDYLKETEGLTYSCDASDFLTAVGDVEQDVSSSTYIYIFTSVEKDQDVSEYKVTISYNDMSLVSSGVGAKDMTITDGAVIYIGTMVW
jgi:hypothetical protein